MWKSTTTYQVYLIGGSFKRVFLICRVKGTCVPHFSYTHVPLKRASAECLNYLNTHNLTQVNDSVRVTLQLGQ